MTFEEILDQAIAMLQRHGRLTYGTLKRQFQLDDAALDDLKNELIEGQRVAVDERGNVLVWTGGADVLPLTTLPASSAVQPRHGLPPPAAPQSLDAERRQLTILFCDLVDSTVLASQLDPEELREVVRAYQDTCAKVIARFEGHIAQYLGDGLLVYFGYPLAHEDDTQRAVRAGLGIVEALGQLNARLAQERGVHLAVRLGVHTGFVVVGDVGGGTRREQLALGETPNVAARLQGLAAPNTLVISAATYQLVQGFFACEDLGTPPLKGVATPFRVYGVRGERTVESRFEAGRASGLTPLIGRDEELGLVLRRWAQAKAGDGQVVLLTGEPGIGKSRLLEAVREQVAAEPHVQLLYQGSPYATHTAFSPITAQLERVAHFAPGDPPAQKLDKLEALLAQSTLRVAEVSPLLAALLSLPTGDRYPPLTLSPQRQKAQTIAALIDLVAGLSRRQPVLCLVEDAHWCDPTTLEVLERLVHRVPELRALVLLTSRPEFTVPWTAAHTTALTLTRLDRAQVAAMVEELTAGKALPREVLAQILDKTDGVPLFVEELTKTVLESGLLREGDGRYVLTGPLPPLAIPATVQDSLMARLDRLAPVKEVAQLGAVLGREFAYAVLAAVSPRREPALSEALEQALRSLAQLPETRATREQAIDLRLALRSALIPLGDFGRILAYLREAEALAVALDDPRRLGRVSGFLARQFCFMGAYDQAIAAGQRAVTLVRASGDRVLEALANQFPGIAHHAQGDYRRAIDAFGQTVMVLEGTQRHERFGQVNLPAVFSRAWLAWCHAELGTFAEGRTLGEEGLRIAEAVNHPHSLMRASWGIGLLALRQGDLPRALLLLERAMGLCQDADLPGLFLEMAAALGAAYTLAGRVADTVPLLTQAIEQAIATEMVGTQALCRLSLGEAQMLAGHLEEAHALAVQALTLARAHQERGNEAYALRLLGQIAAQLHPPEVELAEASYQQALTLADALGMCPLVAHCHLDLGNLYLTMGQREQARAEPSTAIDLYRSMEMTFWLPQAEAALAEVEGC